MDWIQQTGLPASARVWDRTATPFPAAADVLQPFAEEELISRTVGESAAPFVHLWRHERAFVAGLRDRQLPQAAQAMAALREKGYAVGVRHSGGAAVPLHEGVLNVTLILPKRPGAVGIRNDFAVMADWITEAVRRLGAGEAQAGEVAGSYCPGGFDLSLEGRKFCGIAQRRQTKAVAVQAFVIVEGSGEALARVARDFYLRAGGPGAEEIIRPHVMGSLAELSGRGIDVFSFARELLAAAAERMRLQPAALADLPGRMQVEEMIRSLRERYDRDLR